MKASVARTIKSFLRNCLRFLGLRHIRPISAHSGVEVSAPSVTEISLRQDRGDFRDGLVERFGKGFTVLHPVLLRGRPQRRVLWMPLGRVSVAVRWWRPSRARPTSLEGDAGGTHNGLRSRGRFRCLVIRFLPDTPGPASGGYLPEGFPKRRKRVPGCNRAVKQADSKNGEWENPERIFAAGGCNRHGCTRTPAGPLRNGEPGAMWEAA